MDSILEQHASAKRSYEFYQKDFQEEVIAGMAVFGKKGLFFATPERAQHLEDQVEKYRKKIELIELDYAEYFV